MQNHIKKLRIILEGEVEQAEVIIAAKGFSQELQDMIEKVGRLMNEDLGPVTDQMRQAYGPEVAGSFQSSMQGELENVLETLRGAKGSMDSAVASISQGQAPDAGNDMDMDVDMGMDDELGGDDLGMGDELGGDELGGELDVDAELDVSGDIGGGDEFGGEMGIEEPLGRAAKEAKEVALKNKIVEMRKQLARARSIQEKKALAK